MKHPPLNQLRSLRALIMNLLTLQDFQVFYSLRWRQNLRQNFLSNLNCPFDLIKLNQFHLPPSDLMKLSTLLMAKSQSTLDSFWELSSWRGCVADEWIAKSEAVVEGKCINSMYHFSLCAHTGMQSPRSFIWLEHCILFIPWWHSSAAYSTWKN